MLFSILSDVSSFPSTFSRWFGLSSSWLAASEQPTRRSYRNSPTNCGISCSTLCRGALCGAPPHRHRAQGLLRQGQRGLQGAHDVGPARCSSARTFIQTYPQPLHAPTLVIQIHDQSRVKRWEVFFVDGTRCTHTHTHTLFNTNLFQKAFPTFKRHEITHVEFVFV